MSNQSLVTVLILAPLLLTQFGLHMAVLNAPMDYMGCNGVEGLNQDCIEGWNPAWASSAYALGGFLGSTLAGTIVAYKSSATPIHFRIYQLSAVLFGIGSVMMSVVSWQHLVVIARTISGVGAGLSVNCCPILLNRLSPPHRRGLCGSLTQISINFGIILAQLFGIFWATERSWRMIMHTASIFALVNVALAVWKTKPSSIATYSQEAERLARDIEQELQTGEPPEEDSAPPQSVSLTKFFTLDKYRFALICTISIFVVQQATGINSIVQYGVRVMAIAVPEHAKLVNLCVSLINLFMTAVGAGLMDKFGRKALLLSSLALTGIFTGVLAFGLVRGLGGFSVGALILTICAFAIGIGPIPFLYISEIAPKESVGIAQSVGTGASWLSTFVVVALFPGIQRALGPSAFYLFSVLTLASAVWYYFYLPRS